MLLVLVMARLLGLSTEDINCSRGLGPLVTGVTPGVHWGPLVTGGPPVSGLGHSRSLMDMEDSPDRRLGG